MYFMYTNKYIYLDSGVYGTQVQYLDPKFMKDLRAALNSVLSYFVFFVLHVTYMCIVYVYSPTSQ